MNIFWRMMWSLFFTSSLYFSRTTYSYWKYYFDSSVVFHTIHWKAKTGKKQISEVQKTFFYCLRNYKIKIQRLLLGAVFGSIIERSRIDENLRNYSPEKWLKNSFIELHRIFESFDGSMLVSLVLGLVKVPQRIFILH